MVEFFRGWQRKTGCVLLMLALAMLGMWIRSTVVSDTIVFPSTLRNHSLKSSHSLLSWCTVERKADGFRWWSEILAPDDRKDPSLHLTEIREYAMLSKKRINISTTPYWAVTMPLIMLSAYLILCTGSRLDPEPKTSELLKTKKG